MRFLNRRSLIGIGFCSFAAFAVACGGSASTDGLDDPFAGMDAGQREDAGTADAGSFADASSPDATTPDAADTGAPDARTDSSTPLTCAGTCPPGFYDLDSSYGASLPNCGCEYACTKTGNTDPIDATYTDDNCDGSDGLVERCVYVSNSGTDAANGGGRTAPVKTIGYGIDLAFQRGGYVCLGAETFEGAFTLRAGVNVYGGFDAADSNFSFARRSGAASRVQATGYVIDAPAITSATEVAGLTIVSRDISASLLGQSAYGIRIGNASGGLALRWNDITVAAGTPGEAGSDGGRSTSGVTGADGAIGCECPASFSTFCALGENCGSCRERTGGSSVCTTCNGAAVPESCSGAGGTSGFKGASGRVGATSAGGATGGLPGPGGGCSPLSGNGAQQATQGSSGASGVPGQSGSTANGSGTLDSLGRYTPARGSNGAAGRAGAGGGGGGAGGGTTGSVCCSDSGGAGGAGGSGGCGGSPGTGGGAGGGSLGVTCGSGTVVLEGNVIRYGNGGQGGTGGAGASGGSGGIGGNGGAYADDSGPGAKGGSGGIGGAGGAGAGGNGGPATCLAVASGCTATFTVGLGARDNACVANGSGGQGGPGGSSPNGAIGPTGQTGSSQSRISL
jgi:hypothetical protein